MSNVASPDDHTADIAPVPDVSNLHTRVGRTVTWVTRPLGCRRTTACPALQNATMATARGAHACSGPTAKRQGPGQDFSGPGGASAAQDLITHVAAITPDSSQRCKDAFATEEMLMRTQSVSSTLVIALAGALALSGCSKKSRRRRRLQGPDLRCRHRGDARPGCNATGQRSGSAKQRHRRSQYRWRRGNRHGR